MRLRINAAPRRRIDLERVLAECGLGEGIKAIADRWAVPAAQTQRKGIELANIDGLIAAAEAFTQTYHVFILIHPSACHVRWFMTFWPGFRAYLAALRNSGCADKLNTI